MSVHVIGAGLAGLAAACQLTESGHHVVLFEASKTAGGRARSHFDNVLGCRIDNGNHLLLSGNISTLSYLHRVGAKRSLTGPAEPAGALAVQAVVVEHDTAVAATAPNLAVLVEPVTKPVPVMATTVVPPRGPADGASEVTAGTGSKVNRSVPLVAEVPPGVVTVMSTVPADSGGAVAVISPGETTL